MKKIILDYVDIVSPGEFAIAKFCCVAQFMQSLLNSYDFTRFMLVEERSGCTITSCKSSLSYSTTTPIKEINLSLVKGHISSFEDAYEHAIIRDQKGDKVRCGDTTCKGSIPGRGGTGGGTPRLYSFHFLFGPIVCIQLKVRRHGSPAMDTSKMDIKATMMFNDESYK